MDLSEYVTPLKDELNLEVIQMSKEIYGHINYDTGHILLDIDFEGNRRMSSTGITALLANCTFKFDDKKKISVNVTDKKRTKEELLKAKEIMENRLIEKELKEKQKLLKD